MDKTAKIYSSLGVGKVVACTPTTSFRQLQSILKKLGLDGAAHEFRYGNACLLDHLHTPMCGSIGWGTTKHAQPWAIRT